MSTRSSTYGCASGAVVLLLLQANALQKVLFALLLVGNIVFFVVNTWITVNGMGIPFGSQFHIALAAIFAANYFLTSRTHSSFRSLAEHV